MVYNYFSIGEVECYFGKILLIKKKVGGELNYSNNISSVTLTFI